MSKDTDQVIAIERSLWHQANDPKVYQEAMVEGAISVIEPLGFIEKEQAVAYSSKGKPFSGVEMIDLVVHQITPDCIVVAYHGEGTHVGEDKPYQGSIASATVRSCSASAPVIRACSSWSSRPSVRACATRPANSSAV